MHLTTVNFREIFVADDEGIRGYSEEGQDENHRKDVPSEGAGSNLVLLNRFYRIALLFSVTMSHYYNQSLISIRRVMPV